MKFRVTNFLGTLLVFALLFTVGLTVAKTSAQSADQITLGVSPQLLDLTANPGDQLENTFRLTNGSDVPIEIVVTPKNFLPLGEEGAVDLTEETTNFSLAQWIKVTPEKITIPAKKTADFVMKINVPSSAEPGSHFGSVVFQTVPPEQTGTSAAVSQEIAPVILVKIAGDVTEKASIEEFRSTKSFWSNEDTISFLTRVKNEGNVHFQPGGKIVIKNMFGKEVGTVELDRRNVLPGSIRAITSDWRSDGLKFGRYTAELTLVYGKDGNIEQSSTSFTIFPYQVLLPLALGISIVGYLLFRFRKRIILAAKILAGKNTGE